MDLKMSRMEETSELRESMTPDMFAIVAVKGFYGKSWSAVFRVIGESLEIG